MKIANTIITTEWIPSLIATSKAMGKIPKSLNDKSSVDWVPVDVAAKAVLDFTLLPSATPTGLQTFNLANPHLASWADLVPAIQSFYAAQGTTLDTIDYDAWLQELQDLELT